MAKTRRGVEFAAMAPGSRLRSTKHADTDPISLSLFSGSVHVITGDGKYKQSARTTQGSHKWLQTQYWDSTTECLSTAKESGYNIVVSLFVCLFVCLLWSFDAPRPVVLCRTSRTGGVHFRSVTWPAGWTVHENPSPGANLPLRWILAGGQKADPPGAACRLPRVPENARVGLPSSPGPPREASPPGGPS